jgi:hypothetical protein
MAVISRKMLQGRVLVSDAASHWFPQHLGG